MLLGEKIDKERREIEELDRQTKLLQAKSKDIPITNYVQDMQAYRSTKNLTSFKEFNLNGTGSIAGSGSILTLVSQAYSTQRSRDPSNEGSTNKANQTSKFVGLKKNVVELYNQTNTQLRIPQAARMRNQYNSSASQMGGASSVGATTGASRS